MRPRHWGLSERLLALSLVATLACGTAASWLLREQLHDAVLRSFKAGLQDRAERLQAELQSPGPLTGQGTRLNRGEFGRIFSGWYWTLEQDGRLQQSRSVWDDSLELDDARPWPRHKGSETLLSLRGPQGANCWACAAASMSRAGACSCMSSARWTVRARNGAESTASCWSPSWAWSPRCCCARWRWCAWDCSRCAACSRRCRTWKTAHARNWGGTSAPTWTRLPRPWTRCCSAMPRSWSARATRRPT
ncbi:hypothetical protein ACHFCA_00425 [Delftia tsuruhatensis]